MTLDEMKATFWNAVGQRPHMEIEGALAEILRKHIEPMLMEAHDEGQHFAVVRAVNREVAVRYAARIVAAATATPTPPRDGA